MATHTRACAHTEARGQTPTTLFVLVRGALLLLGHFSVLLWLHRCGKDVRRVLPSAPVARARPQRTRRSIEALSRKGSPSRNGRRKFRDKCLSFLQCAKHMQHRDMCLATT
ncbi:unnamed protein product [Pleuronectes platessa]|uniref:Uncharacterized protein n=1 Tax=Pleuronectes platessa TaxID=8262 RepID=A0A9N7Y9B2_PLEPL|nr:unnamed protein product [Pleuronectes platessa]